jgi:RNA recognition motif-containing protein
MMKHAGKIFVGGLSWETTEDELLVYFEKYGDVVDVVIMTDTATKRSRGFGFVTFKNAASADAACDHIDHVIDSRKIDVKLSELRFGLRLLL